MIQMKLNKIYKGCIKKNNNIFVSGMNLEHRNHDSRDHDDRPHIMHHACLRMIIYPTQYCFYINYFENVEPIKFIL